MKRKYIKYIFFLLMLLFIIFLYRSCNSFFGSSYDREFTYTSPEGTNTIVVKYDFVSRPSVFKKGVSGDEKIWTYPNNGFNETVSFHVEWLSENQIRLIYNDKHDEFDEEYIITIPEQPQERN